MGTALRMRCPHCGTVLDKGPAAFVLGAAGHRVKDDDPLPGAVTCPRCGKGIPTKGMVEGLFDERPDYATIPALVVAGAAAFVRHYGYLDSGFKSAGYGVTVFMLIVGAAAMAEYGYRKLRR